MQCKRRPRFFHRTKEPLPENKINYNHYPFPPSAFVHAMGKLLCANLFSSSSCICILHLAYTLTHLYNSGLSIASPRYLSSLPASTYLPHTSSPSSLSPPSLAQKCRCMISEKDSKSLHASARPVRINLLRQRESQVVMHACIYISEFLILILILFWKGAMLTGWIGRVEFLIRWFVAFVRPWVGDAGNTFCTCTCTREGGALVYVNMRMCMLGRSVCLFSC
ncbi:hypothetical protein B0J11DRAFT_106376 [Dendryphion nanum]|uniref:Uncharacterized protein n=1 Tax=Dendryphion nanum TaxID=256645 RepID=A0A9P9DD72_9PLEO|nr:hypothetical protein B0J11DRAFT_106376 [Dendryphion nanum]